MATYDPYAKLLVKLLNGKEIEVRTIYYDAINDLTALAATIPYNGTIFNLSLYPLLKLRVDYIVNEMVGKLQAVVVNGIEGAFQLSDKNNQVFLDKNLKGVEFNRELKQVLYDSNAGASQAYIERREAGLGLSDKVTKLVEPFKNELEMGLGTGIANGESAAKMATELKKALVEPDRLFRRVRDAQGRLKLSKPAQAYRPGQGVYRSSYKNILRITRTETNIAYRTADYNRWQGMAIVVGYEIKLSGRHPKYDICDKLAGFYPKDFMWTGWHPQCICYMVPVMMTQEEISARTKAILLGEEVPTDSVNTVKDMPPAFYDWLRANKDKINGMANQPYWVADNPKYTELLGE